MNFIYSIAQVSVLFLFGVNSSINLLLNRTYFLPTAVLAHSLTYRSTHSLTHPLTYSLDHSLTHSAQRFLVSDSARAAAAGKA